MEQEIKLEVSYEEIEAINDYMGKTSRVVGKCVVAHGGVALVTKKLDSGFNPQMLRLELEFVLTAEDPSSQPIHWQEDWDGGDPQYTEVEFTTNLDVEVPPVMTFRDVH